MFGWLKRIASQGSPQDTGFGHLRAGQRYEVVRAFSDHDGILHPVGERWTFLRSNFLPYDDGLSLFVASDGGQEVQIRLQWRAEAEGAIIDGLDQYLRAVPNDVERVAFGGRQPPRIEPSSKR